MDFDGCLIEKRHFLKFDRKIETSTHSVNGSGGGSKGVFPKQPVRLLRQGEIWFDEAALQL
jgi:hypothetical protein